jgi:hypothetical protein
MIKIDLRFWELVAAYKYLVGEHVELDVNSLDPQGIDHSYHLRRRQHLSWRCEQLSKLIEDEMQVGEDRLIAVEVEYEELLAVLNYLQRGKLALDVAAMEYKSEQQGEERKEIDDRFQQLWRFVEAVEAENAMRACIADTAPVQEPLPEDEFLDELRKNAPKGE